MKKTYTFEVTSKPQWPSMRCPNCNSGIINIWHLIDNGENCVDRTQSTDPYPYQGEWQWKCSYCGLEAPSMHSRKLAKRQWKILCQGG